jgi:hypothetical protein
MGAPATAADANRPAVCTVAGATAALLCDCPKFGRWRWGEVMGQAMAKGILLAAMDFTDVAEDEFHDWYDLEHIPERQRVPGFRTCERWIGTANPKISIAT